MPRRNEYTFVVEVPMSHESAERHAKFLTGLFLKKNGLTADISPRELHPGEEPRPIQLPKDVLAAG